MAKLDATVLHRPAVVHEFNQRVSDTQLRIADKITGFAGSMHFVYLHAIRFAVWMLVFEKRSPLYRIFPKLGLRSRVELARLVVERSSAATERVAS